MPAAIDEIIKRKVIEQWLSGCPRDKIAEDNNIGTGTVTSIVNNYKVALENSDFESVRDLAVEARKQELNLADLASHIRLYNYFRKSGAAEDKIESFVANISSSNLPPEKVIELVYQLNEISREESIQLDQVASYIEKKLEEKQNIDEQIKEADAILQSKNISIQAINEHMTLNEKLNEHGLSTYDIDKLLNLIANAKEYGFDSKKIMSKLHSMKQLGRREKGLENNCVMLSKQIAKYKDIMPLTEEIAALSIGIDELIALKAGINQAVKRYNLPHLAATLRLIDDIKKYNKINGLKKELSVLYLQKHMLDEACSRQGRLLVNLDRLRSYGLTEDRILQMNNLLFSNNGYRDMKPSS